MAHIRAVHEIPQQRFGVERVAPGDLLLGVYAHLQSPVHRVLPDEASMVKYASNNFHAIKVAFAKRNQVSATAIAGGRAKSSAEKRKLVDAVVAGKNNKPAGSCTGREDRVSDLPFLFLYLNAIINR